MSFNFQWGGQTYNQTLASRVEGVNPNSNCDRRVLYDRWKKPGDPDLFLKNIALEENCVESDDPLCTGLQLFSDR